MHGPISLLGGAATAWSVSARAAASDAGDQISQEHDA
jgi:hypothetical protein